MARLIILSVVLPAVLLVVVKCSLAVNFGGLPYYTSWAEAVQNKSERCIANTVTRASCANMKGPGDMLMAHPDDCRLFYYCMSPILPPACRDCPFELHFNPTLRVCDWPYRAGCKVNKA
ncbi:probable chitinase 10 [Aricia agestis]|uniref:probable chitinase 10 n=1 Tax=Aricia agestis TaxID=91739 RepID=UPI001C201A97|nr:probable chitinase 10 [Aricia agestis]